MPQTIVAICSEKSKAWRYAPDAAGHNKTAGISAGLSIETKCGICSVAAPRAWIPRAKPLKLTTDRAKNGGARGLHEERSEQDCARLAGGRAVLSVCPPSRLFVSAGARTQAYKQPCSLSSLRSSFRLSDFRLGLNICKPKRYDCFSCAILPSAFAPALTCVSYTRALEQAELAVTIDGIHQRLLQLSREEEEGQASVTPTSLSSSLPQDHEDDQHEDDQQQRDQQHPEQQEGRRQQRPVDDSDGAANPSGADPLLPPLPADQAAASAAAAPAAAATTEDANRPGLPSTVFSVGDCCLAPRVFDRRRALARVEEVDRSNGTCLVTWLHSRRRGELVCRYWKEVREEDEARLINGVDALEKVHRVTLSCCQNECFFRLVFELRSATWASLTGEHLC